MIGYEDYVRWLIAAYLYYKEAGEDTGMTDAEWDYLSRYFYKNKDKFTDDVYEIIHRDDFDGGSLFWLKREDYPEVVFESLKIGNWMSNDIMEEIRKNFVNRMVKDIDNKIMEEAKMNPICNNTDIITTKPYYKLAITSDFDNTSDPVYKLMKQSFEIDWKNYKFKSLNESDIDFYKIAEDISKANPVALVDVNGNKKRNVFAVVHYSVPEKAQKVDKLRPSTFYEYFIGPDFIIYEMDHVKYFDDVIAWAKQVKNAKWPERNKATVTVSIPKV